MKKINRFLLLYLIVITVLCAYMCYVAFYKRNSNVDIADKVQSTMMKEKIKKSVKEKEAEKDKITYELAIKDKELVVLETKTKRVFEYTNLKEKHLPVEVQKMLKHKTLFYSPEDVYHFLESYSS